MKEVILIIDMQNFFINEKNYFLIDKINNYIEENNFDFILYSKFINSNNSNFVKKLNWKECFNSPDIDINKDLFYKNKWIVFEKNTYSVFKSKDFIDFLNNNNIDKINICWLDTDACVLATSFDWFDIWYDINILYDLIYSSWWDENHKCWLRILKRNIN